MNLAKFAIEKRVISAIAAILILLAGYYAYQNLPRFEDPEFIIRSAQIITPYPGASAEEVAQEVTDVIENAVQQLQGVKEVKSVSTIGLSEVTVEFTIASAKTRPTLNQKFTQLRAKINDSQSSLPPNASASTVYDDYGDVYAVYFAITGEGYSLPELYEYAKTLQQEIVLVPGVSKVAITGNPQEVIYVEFTQSRLTQLGLASDQIAQLLQGKSLITPAGSVKAGERRLVIRPASAVDSVNAIAELVITNSQSGRTYRLKDIATISRGTEDPIKKLMFRDGQPAIGLGISNTIGGNVVNMGDAVRERLTELDGSRPIGIDLSTISDQSVSVRTSVQDFVMNVALALIIVVGTLLIFMGLRSGLLMGGILLITVAGTLFGMYVFGLNMQRVSLGALIIALGMLVDNAIVVVEGVLVRVQKGEDTKSAAIGVVEKTKWPLLGGTIVGFLAFSAVGFSPDNTGEYAGSLFWTITIALLFSWLIAVWLTPYLCTLFLKPNSDKTTVTGVKENTILRAYRNLLRFALQIKWITIAIVVSLFVSSLLLFSFVKQGFFPASTRAQFVVDFSLPEGTDIETTARDLNQIDTWVRGLDGVTSTNLIVGSGHLRFMLTYNAESPNSGYGQILVDVESYDQIDPLLVQIQAHLSGNYPDSFSKVWKFSLGPGGRQPD